MRWKIWCSIAHYLTYFILISLSNEVPLSGENVRDAEPNELPFVVFILRISGKYTHSCTGTLISQKSVLTAAHCVVGNDTDKISILVGNDLRKGKYYKARSWISYWQWMNTTNSMFDENNHIVDDIAVITLKQKVQEVNATAISTVVREDLNGQQVRIAGWGRHDNGTRPMILQTGVVNVLSNEACKDKLMFWTIDQTRILAFIREHIFCTSIDPWVIIDQGDSGGPVLNEYHQVVGITISRCHPDFRKQISTHYPEHIVCLHTVNLHVHLYPYRNFINDVK